MTALAEAAGYRGAYDLTEEQELFKRTLHEFGEREIVPIAHELDEREQFPRETVGKMAELGLMGLFVPEQYGGTGASTLDYVLAMEEISWADASHSVVMSVTNSLVCDPIFRFGTEDQKQRHLPALAQGQYLGAYCLTEPTSGSDASNMQTCARRDGDSYVLNGTKSWITNGGEAGVYLVYALTNLDVSKSRGITAFLVEADTPGLRPGPKEKKLGIRASSTTQIFFEDCRVPVSAVLGRVDEGFRIAMATLDGGRIGIGAQSLGIAQRALDESRRYAQEREAFGHPIADFQGLQWRLADMATRIEAARLLVYRAVANASTGFPSQIETSMAKAYANEMAEFVTNEALQVFGAAGYLRTRPLERMVRDARAWGIAGGTVEIQLTNIASELFGRRFSQRLPAA